MAQRPSFDRTAPVGRLVLLFGAYAPMLAIVGLRHGLDCLGIALCVAALAGSVLWLGVVLWLVRRRQIYEINLAVAEPIDRDVTAYVATYLFPVLAAQPKHFAGYLAYGLAAFLILVVAYRADLGAINPLAYLFRFRAYRVSAEDGVRIVLSRSSLIAGATWQVQEVAGVVVTRDEVCEAQ